MEEAVKKLGFRCFTYKFYVEEKRMLFWVVYEAAQ